MTALLTRFLGEGANRLGAHQWVVRAPIPLATAVMLVVTARAGAPPGDLTVAIAFFLSVVTLRSPDSYTPTALIAVLCWQWWRGTGDPRTPLVVAAAAALLVIHVSAALAATAPPQGRFDRSALLRWARDVVLVGGLTALVWAATLAVNEVRGPGSVFSTFGALLAVAAVALLLRRDSMPPP